MTKIAVVGTGKIAKEMLPVFANMKEIQVVAICGTKRSQAVVEALQEEYQIPRAYTALEELLTAEQTKSDKCDAIYLAVPNHLHYPLARASLEAGYHIFVEKPFTLRYEEAKELVELARQKQLFILEAISNQYLPMFEQMKKSLSLVGEIRLVEMNFSQYSSRYDDFLEGEYFPVFDPAIGGGALYDINIYNLHLAIGLFGAPESAEYDANYVREVDTSGVIKLKYPGFLCHLMGAKDCQGPSGVLIQGTKGYLRLEASTNKLDGTLTFYDVKTKSISVLYEPDTTVHRMVYEFLEFDRILANQNWDESYLQNEKSLEVMKTLELLAKRSE